MNDGESRASRGMKPIWYFVGCLLVLIGGIITGTGIYNLSSPPARSTAAAELHTDVWWGAAILLFGAVLFLFNRNATVE